MKKLPILFISLATIVAVAGNLPFITRVLEFNPAPGQFTNTMPVMEAGESADSLLPRVEKLICGYEKISEAHLPGGVVIRDTTQVIADGMICLGACGGYVVFGFDHPVINVEGEYDFQVLGNSFAGEGTGSGAGSSEPGVVYVSEDVNDNGLADDPWYELAGSEYNNPHAVHGYEITYYKPDPNKVPTKVNNFILDDTYIRWTSNDPDSLQEGYIDRLSFHRQNYWPEWIDGETMTFHLTKLPCNGFTDTSSDGAVFVQRAFDWGYVDNRQDYRWNEPLTDSIRNTCNLGFKIDWAVDNSGRPANLRKIDFVKVATGVNQKNGWLGEISTEVAGAFDIHPDAPLPEPQPVRGDLNGDGQVNSGDVSVLYDIIIRGKNDPAADLNDDGNVNTGDVSVLYGIILGMN